MCSTFFSLSLIKLHCANCRQLGIPQHPRRPTAPPPRNPAAALTLNPGSIRNACCICVRVTITVEYYCLIPSLPENQYPKPTLDPHSNT